MSKRVFLRNCKVYLSHQGWLVNKPWETYSDMYIIKDNVPVNVAIVVKPNALHKYFINDARDSMRSTRQMVAIVTSYIPSVTEQAYAEIRNVPLLHYKYLSVLMSIIAEVKAIDAEQNPMRYTASSKQV